MQDVMFETIAQVLQIDSTECQWAAIHGLSHLHHPETVALIYDFLSRHPHLDRPTKRYALSVATHEPYWTTTNLYPEGKRPVNSEEFAASLEIMRRRAIAERNRVRVLRKQRQKSKISS